MVRGGVGLMKLKCGEAAKRSATRFPTSRGEAPRGQPLKSDRAAAPGARDAARAAAQAARSKRFLIDCPPSVYVRVGRSAVSRSAPEFDRQRVALPDEVCLGELAAAEDIDLQSIARARDGEVEDSTEGLDVLQLHRVPARGQAWRDEERAEARGAEPEHPFGVDAAVERALGREVALVALRVRLDRVGHVFAEEPAP